MSLAATATLPPPGLPGLDPAWSRLVEAADAEGVRRTWHVLDDGRAPVRGTVLCVHGNPTWSYLWRHLLREAPEGYRVVAVDQLGMGWSERPAAPHRLQQRIDDLGGLTDALGITGPVVLVAHDWGGPVALGWALAHRKQVAGIVLTNTAVHQPEGSAPPALIRLARSAPLLRAVTERTPVFVRATTALSRPPLPRAVRDAFAAPYATPERRRHVPAFVADVPFEPDHPSAGTLRGIVEGLPALADVPALLVWGPRDPVFSERYLRDLHARLPQAQVHRYEGASHLVTEDRPESAAVIARWLADLAAPAVEPEPPQPARPPVAAPWAALEERAGDPAPAVVELGPAGVRREVGFDALARRVRGTAAGLAGAGVRPGQRVALLVPPGADLTAAVYACWRAGAVIVVADAGLGLPGLARALRGAHPDHVVGVARGLAAAAAMRVPGRRILVGDLPAPARRALRVEHTLDELAHAGAGDGATLAERVDPDAEAAVVFTSGATGPAKGVVYRYRQLLAQLEVIRTAYDITSEDRLVAAFAPFALYGPALGIPSSVPDMDVTAPGTLTASALADAVAAVEATVVFASPAALRNVVATSDRLSEEQRKHLARPRIVLSAGAPVPAALLRRVREVLPHAEPHTPYGMTEALPVTDISLSAIEEAGEGEGVCVGRPLPGVDIRVSPLAPDGRADAPLTDEPGRTGEVCVRAAHVKDRYDRLWATQRESARDPGWHRTGDVGHLDDTGRLWVEGRLVHVVTTPDGPLPPVAPEQRIERLPDVRVAALAAVGPAGTQQPVAVVVPADESLLPRNLLRRAGGGLAGPGLADEVRRAAGVDLAAVLLAPRLPVDIRHASKVDRSALSRWAERLLAGRAALLP